MVMVSNCMGWKFGLLFGKYEGTGLLGHLYNPGGTRGPFPEAPWSGDNECYVLKQKNIPFRAPRWRLILVFAGRAAALGLPPGWLLCPDEPYDRERTLAMWAEFSPEIRAAGFRPAFAVQDEMTFDDVPDSECMIFIGGSTGWKEAAIVPWCRRFPGRVHVGRVTERDRLMKCYEAGAVSVDGNDWWREKNKGGQRPQFPDLKEYLAMASQKQRRRAA
jgi:hypothetical protein